MIVRSFLGMPGMGYVPFYIDTHIGSNLCYDGHAFYVCDGSYVYGYSRQIKKLWKKRLDMAGSHMCLSVDGARLNVFSFGDGDRDGKKVKSGKSFYMEFDKASGESLCSYRLSEGRKYAVDTLRSGVRPRHVLFAESVVTLADGKAPLVTPIPEGVFGKAARFVSGPVFLAREGSMDLKEIKSDSLLLVATNSQRLFMFSHAEPFGRVYDADDVYQRHFDIGGLCCLRSVGDRKLFCLCDKNMQLLLQFDDDVVDVRRMGSGIAVLKRNANIIVDGNDLRRQLNLL